MSQPETYSRRRNLFASAKRSDKTPEKPKYGFWHFTSQDTTSRVYTTGDVICGDLVAVIETALHVSKIWYTLECIEKCNLKPFGEHLFKHCEQKITVPGFEDKKKQRLEPGHHTFPCKFNLNDVADLPPTFSLEHSEISGSGVMWLVTSHIELVEQRYLKKERETLERSFEVLFYPRHSPVLMSSPRRTINSAIESSDIAVSLHLPMWLPQPPQRFSAEIALSFKQPVSPFELITKLERVTKVTLCGQEQLFRSYLVLGATECGDMEAGSLNFNQLVKDCRLKNLEPGSLQLRHIDISYNILCIARSNEEEVLFRWSINVMPPFASGLKENSDPAIYHAYAPPEYSK